MTAGTVSGASVPKGAGIGTMPLYGQCLSPPGSAPAAPGYGAGIREQAVRRTDASHALDLLDMQMAPIMPTMPPL